MDELMCAYDMGEYADMDAADFFDEMSEFEEYEDEE